MVEYSAYNVRKFKTEINGKALELLSPKVRQVDEINSFSVRFRTEGVTTDEIAEIAVLILNRNTNKEQFDKQFVEELEYDIVYRLIFDYIAWVNEIHENPNSDSPSAQG